MNQDRLYRSVEDRVLAGVCGGLADRLGLDPSLVRIVWVLLTFASGGLFFLLYIIMAVVVPEEHDVGYFPVVPMPPPPPAWPGDAGVGAAPVAGAGPDAGTTAAPGAPASSVVPPASGWVAPSSWVAPSDQAQWQAERQAARAARKAARGPGQGSMVLGVILILLGGWFLIEQYVPAFNPERFWPFALLFLGVVLLAFAFGGWPGKGREDKQ